MALVSGYSMGYSLKRVSVHDPSIVWDSASKTYYIFGSHRATAKTTDLMRWTTLTAPWATANSTNAANNVAFTSPQVTKIKKNGAEVNFSFNAMAWSKRGNANYNVDGNMWAPDVVYNKAMQKWCMYLSINGDNWYSSIILLTSDKITGPYATLTLCCRQQLGTPLSQLYRPLCVLRRSRQTMAVVRLVEWWHLYVGTRRTDRFTRL